MKNILVSGASGIVGYGILRSLRKSGKELKLIGTTIYEDSVAQGFCDIFERAIPTNDVQYIQWLTNVVREHQIDFIIPGIEADLYKWVDHIAEIEKSGTTILLNDIELIGLCKDKWSFYENLKTINSPYVIESSIADNYDFLVAKFGSPFLLKPRRGYGSKGIVKVESENVFREHQRHMGSVLMAQQIVGEDNEEYTTSAFCDGNGGFFAYMTLKRKLSRDGFTDKAEVTDLEDVRKVITHLCERFKPKGPTNFQFRKHDGVLKLLEINPRISSSTSIRSSFGYNESLMAIEYYLENKIPQQPLIKKGRAVRYIEDFIFYEDRIDF